MAVDNHIIGKVESAIVELLKQRLDGVIRIFDADIEKSIDKIKRFPAIMVSTDSMNFDAVTEDADEVKSVTHVYALFQNSKAVHGERFRRHGVYPMVVGISKLLKGKDFNLDIDELQPKSAKEIITKDTRERDIVMFDIAFKWDFEIETDKTDEELAADLLEIANTFMLDGEHEIVTDINQLNEE